jgi:hypothetical protein
MAASGVSHATPRRPLVRATRCDHQASQEQINLALQGITDPLAATWERLERAKLIVIKFNMMKRGTARFHGRRQELVDEAVMRGVLTLLTSRTDARLVALDTCVDHPDYTLPEDLEAGPLLGEFGVEVVDANQPPHRFYRVPGAGNMFDRYLLHSIIAEADEFVSVAKMKNHLFMGVTLSMKNLFGLPPTQQAAGRVRHYFHHAIRLSYVLPDLAMITNPCLNIIDGLVGQQGSEWDGRPVIGDALIAGDQTTATDACAAHLMGVDPTSDWPTPPFRRDRNHILVAAERGYGTANLAEIDFESALEAPIAEFDSDQQEAPAVVHRLRRTASEQALYYRDNRESFVSRYSGQMIALRDGEVIWHGTEQPQFSSHGDLAQGAQPGSASWLKMVDPDELEGEVFGVYDEQLASLA